MPASRRSAAARSQASRQSCGTSVAPSVSGSDRSFAAQSGAPAAAIAGGAAAQRRRSSPPRASTARTRSSRPLQIASTFPAGISSRPTRSRRNWRATVEVRSRPSNRAARRERVLDRSRPGPRPRLRRSGRTGRVQVRRRPPGLRGPARRGSGPRARQGRREGSPPEREGATAARGFPHRRRPRRRQPGR